jgi:hypothetical protein
MIAAAIIGGVVLTVVLVVAGYTSTAGDVPFTITTTAGAPGDCATACSNFIRMRDQTRAATAAVATAQALHDAKAKEYWSVVGIHLALVAAVAVAAGVPIIGPLLAAAMLASVAALVMFSLVLLGQLIGLLQNLINAQSALGTLRKAEADALAQLRQSCSEAEVAMCMARP